MSRALPLLSRFVRSISSQSVHTNKNIYADFNKLAKELREISQILSQPNEMPSTQILRELGHNQLIQAIRKKHGGFVQVAAKLGWEKRENKAIALQEKINARTVRRKKRHQRIAKHNFF